MFVIASTFTRLPRSWRGGQGNADPSRRLVTTRAIRSLSVEKSLVATNFHDRAAFRRLRRNSTAPIPIGEATTSGKPWVRIPGIVADQDLTQSHPPSGRRVADVRGDSDRSAVSPSQGSKSTVDQVQLRVPSRATLRADRCRRLVAVFPTDCSIWTRSHRIRPDADEESNQRAQAYAEFAHQLRILVGTAKFCDPGRHR